MKVKTHLRTILIAVGAVALIAGGIASAESPGEEVMSCVHKRTGKVRIVDGPEDC